ncbi:MAG: serine/threonine protein kinase [Muribaculaceae bacterium]|nr:serine/threonine protein kinase [Muribaculaceae bacterium]
MAEGKKYEQALPVGFKLTGGSHVYTIEQVLGQGGFGITYKVKARIKAGNITVTTHFAVKEFFPSSCWRDEGSTNMLYSPTTKEEMQACLKDFIAEGQRLQRICSINSNIVSVNEVFEANSTAYFVMEYLSGGDLRKMVKDNGGGLSEATMLSILTPVAGAIQCLHDNHMLHLDIKPENIVMRQSDDGGPDVPVLIDFGISVHFSSDGAPTTTRPSKGVTQGYSPVEQFAGVSYFDPRIDIYALSATCYFLLTGKDPKSAFAINAATISADLSGKASQVTIDNIVRGMSKEFSERPATIKQFMSGFEASVSLNPGAVVKGMYQSYIITAVIDGGSDYVLYKALLSSNSSNEYATRRIGGGNASSMTPFMLWERLNNGARINPAAASQMAPWSVPLERGYNSQAFGGQADENKAVVSEYFVDDGVEYVAVRQDYVEPQEAETSTETRMSPGVYAQQDYSYSDNLHQGKPKRKSNRGLIIALSAVATILVVGLATWGFLALTGNGSRGSKGGKGGKGDGEKSLQYAIDHEDMNLLQEYAEMDSARAYYPLAILYDDKEDYVNALKWAQEALYSNELSESERRSANKLVERLNNYIEAENNYYPSMDTDEVYSDDEVEPVG